MVKIICPCGFAVPKGQPCDCRAKRQVERQRANDQARGTPAKRGYDAAWRKVRGEHLAANPRCVECGGKATHVDHIQSVREAPRRRLDRTNLRSMCHSCHSRRTARDQSQAWGRKVT
ncbi:HNH endonuclease [Nitratireductor rhodophyticola]|uniref:HNH endonuclease n=1 Tax=Nitratireductor rhodophyticola TaxID=2854036 RepID=UPI0038F5DF12